MVTRFPISSVAADAINLRQAMDRLVNESFAPGRTRTVWSASRPNRGQASVALDVFATDEGATVLAAVPGVDPEQIEISIERNTVTLKGEIVNAASSEQAKDATWYLHELPWGSFQRSLTLPWDVDVDGVDATFQHGLLRLTVPKAASARPKQISVRVDGGLPTAIDSGQPDDSGESAPTN